MKVTFTKRQLRLAEEENGKTPYAVQNSEKDQDSSSLISDISKVSQQNSDHRDMTIDTTQYTSKKPTGNGQEVTIQGGPGASTEAKKIIDSTNSQTLPKSITIKAEGITFSKAELDRFLTEI